MHTAHYGLVSSNNNDFLHELQTGAEKKIYSNEINFMRWFIIEDQRWVCSYHKEKKQQFSKSHNLQNQTRGVRSGAPREDAYFFFNIHVVVQLRFIPHGRTVKVALYCNV